jgi:cytochrome c553
MRKVTMMAVVSAVLVLAACRSDEVTAPTARGLGSSPSMSSGHLVADTLCATCHGASLTGDPYHNDPTPSLVAARQYTWEEFNLLLIAGQARDGSSVRHGMGVTAVYGLPEAQRRAVYDYLVNVWEQ